MFFLEHSVLVCHCKYSSILYRCCVVWRWKYCNLEIWVRGHSRSLKTAPFESNYGGICIRYDTIHGSDRHPARHRVTARALVANKRKQQSIRTDKPAFVRIDDGLHEGLITLQFRPAVHAEALRHYHKHVRAVIQRFAHVSKSRLDVDEVRPRVQRTNFRMTTILTTPSLPHYLKHQHNNAKQRTDICTPWAIKRATRWQRLTDVLKFFHWWTQ